MTTTRAKAAKATTTEYVAELAPDGLLLDGNVRTKVKRDAAFAALSASVAELGVVQPITVWRPGADAPMTVLRGQRRTLAALDAGKSVPGIVITGAEDEARRIAAGLAENLHREDLTAADTAAAVAALFDLKVAAGKVGKITGIGRKAITQARAVAANETALATARTHTHLTLDEVAAIAEFADEPAIAEHLAGEAGNRNFAHTVQHHRDKRTEAKAAAKLTAELEAGGYTVYQSGNDQGEKLYALTDDRKAEHPKSIDEDDHTECPGRAALLVRNYGASSDIWRWVGRCTQPGLHKVIPHMGAGQAGSAGGPMNETQKAERRQVIDNNKWWRSATTVRTAWLAEFAQRTKPPADALPFILEAVARDDSKQVTSSWDYNPEACAALGITDPAHTGDYTSPPGKTEVLAMLDKAGKDRAMVVAVVLLLGSYERELNGGNTWRHVNTTKKRYMEALDRWGYPVSDVERIILDGRLDRHVHWPEGEVTYLKTDKQIAAERNAAEKRMADLAGRGRTGSTATRTDPEADEAIAAAQVPAGVGVLSGEGDWPRMVAGEWCDRVATPDDPDDEIIAPADEADGNLYHLAGDDVVDAEILDTELGDPDVTIGVSVAQPGDGDEPEKFPRIVTGRWVDRVATETDPEDEIVYPAEGPAYHIAGNEGELDAAAGVRAGDDDDAG